MPRDSNGNYTLPIGNPVITGTVIDSDWANTTMGDLAAALSDSLSRSGNGGMQAPFLNADGTVSAPGMSFTNAPTTGIFRDSVGVGFSWTGVEKMRYGPTTIRFGPAAAPWCNVNASGIDVLSTVALRDSDNVARGSIVGNPVGAGGGGVLVNADGKLQARWSADTVNSRNSYDLFNFAGDQFVTQYVGALGSLTVRVPTVDNTFNVTERTTGTFLFSVTKGSIQGAAGAAIMLQGKVGGNTALYYKDSAGAVKRLEFWDEVGGHTFTDFTGSFNWRRASDGTLLMVLDASGNLTATGNVTAFSDERMKDDKINMIGLVDKLRNIAPIQFKWNQGMLAGQVDFGLSAQNVRPWFPEAVFECDKGFLTINYGKMVAPAIGAINELTSIIESMEIRHRQDIARLEERLAALEAKG